MGPVQRIGPTIGSDVVLLTTSPRIDEGSWDGHAALCFVWNALPRRICFDQGWRTTFGDARAAVDGLLLRQRTKSVQVAQEDWLHIHQGEMVYSQTLKLSDAEARTLFFALQSTAGQFHEDVILTNSGPSRTRDALHAATNGRLRVVSDQSGNARLPLTSVGRDVPSRLVALTFAGASMSQPLSRWDAAGSSPGLRVAIQETSGTMATRAGPAQTTSPWILVFLVPLVSALLLSSAVVVGLATRPHPAIGGVVAAFVACLWTWSLLGPQPVFRFAPGLLLATPIDVAAIWRGKCGRVTSVAVGLRWLVLAVTLGWLVW